MTNKHFVPGVFMDMKIALLLVPEFTPVEIFMLNKNNIELRSVFYTVCQVVE